MSRSGIPVAFGIAALPEDRRPRMVARCQRGAVDLLTAWRHGLLGPDIDPEPLGQSSLNRFLAQGRQSWRALAQALSLLLEHPAELPPGVWHATDELDLRLPVEVGDYVDGYGGIHHAENMGRLLRPGAEPLAPNWRHVPVAYHGRSSTVVVSGCPITRPRGVVAVDGVAVLAPTNRLDIELEVGFVVGVGNQAVEAIPITEAAEHIFGVVLLNDWSARDIQAYESQPLGPFLGKSFATSISAWVVPLDALAGHMVPGLAAEQDPPPLPYLHTSQPWVPDLHLQVLLQSQSMRSSGAEPAVISQVEYAQAMYWSMAQQLAHATVNGATVRPGDIFGSGTASGPDPATSGGSLLELSWGGSRPFELPGGEQRTFLEDGDTVTLRGWCSPSIALGNVTATVLPAPSG